MTRTSSRLRDAKPESGEVSLIRSDRVRRQSRIKLSPGHCDRVRNSTKKRSPTPSRCRARLCVRRFVSLLPRTRRMATPSSAVVAKITASTMVEMFEVMAELEVSGRVGGPAYDADRTRNSEIHPQTIPTFRRSKGSGRLSRSEQDISPNLYAGSRNRYPATRPPRYTIDSAFRAFQSKHPDALRLASEEHEAIIDAIVAADGEEAYKLSKIMSA